MVYGIYGLDTNRHKCGVLRWSNNNYRSHFDNTYTSGSNSNALVDQNFVLCWNNYDSKSSIKIYRFKLYWYQYLVRDMIPVRDFANRVCMYDMAENRFFYNNGTGDFIAGPVIQQ